MAYVIAFKVRVFCVEGDVEIFLVVFVYLVYFGIGGAKVLYVGWGEAFGPYGFAVFYHLVEYDVPREVGAFLYGGFVFFPQIT